MPPLVTHRADPRASVQSPPLTPDGGPATRISVAVPVATYTATIAAVRARIDAGEGTPVLASHLDALGLRGVVEALARAAS